MTINDPEPEGPCERRVRVFFTDLAAIVLGLMLGEYLRGVFL